jgi:uncharacterized OB-fold protein
MSQSTPEILSQSFELGFTYTRSTGPVIGRFLTGLRDHKLVGNRGADGTVYLPPVEFDPVTAKPVDDFVEVGETGTVQTWSWVHHPRVKHLLDRPFAYALVKLEGADVPMLHIVDAGEESAMSTGMAVKVRWADETRGHITDIACFVPA